MYKICHFIFEHRPFDGRVFYKEAISLAKAGYDVTILAPSIDKKSLGRRREVDLPATGSLIKHGVKFEYYYYNKMIPKLFGLRNYFTLRSVLHKIEEINADVCHFHEDRISFDVCLEVKKRFPDKKIVYDFHEFFQIKYREKIRHPEQLLKYIDIENKIIAAADMIITVSDFITAYFKILKAKEVVTIMNCQSKAIFQDRAMDADQDATFFVCHEGRMIFDRGLKLILEVANCIREPNIKFLIIGDLAKFEKIYFQNKIDEYRLHDKFEITGWLNYDEIDNYFLKAKLGIFFMQSINGRSGIANKFFNYLRYGIPILSLDVPSTNDIITQYNCGYIFKETDPELIAKQIEDLYRDKSLYQKISENSKNAFEQKYNWETMEKILVNAYEKLLLT